MDFCYDVRVVSRRIGLRWMVVALTLSIVAPLGEDRPLGIDAEALYAALSSGKWQA